MGDEAAYSAGSKCLIAWRGSQFTMGREPADVTDLSCPGMHEQSRIADVRIRRLPTVFIGASSTCPEGSLFYAGTGSAEDCIRIRSMSNVSSTSFSSNASAKDFKLAICSVSTRLARS